MPAAACTVGAATHRGQTSKAVVKLANIDKKLRKGASDDTVTPWIRTEKADLIFGLAIFLNAAFIGIDVELDSGFSFPDGFWIIESIFLFVFLVELILRIMAEKPSYWRYFDAWGVFDFCVTILGIIDAWIVTPVMAGSGNSSGNPLSSFTVLRVFRLIRLVRLIRVLRMQMFSELAVLVQTIGNSMRAVAWMSLLLGMIMYTGSIITVLLIGQPHAATNPAIKEYFGSLGSALFSHFCVVTLEGWPDIATSAMEVNRLWAVYFIAVIVLTNFALVNLMVGVIVEKIINYSVEQESAIESFVAESDQFRKTLQTLFDSADLDSSGTVTRADVRELLSDPRTQDIFQAVGINPNIPKHTLHTIMDLHHDGPTNFQEFFDACLRLCGSKNSIHSVFVQHDICECQQTLSLRLARLEEQVAACAPRMRNRRPSSAAARDRETLRGASSSTAPAARTPESEDVQEALHQLLDRMDQFGLVQQQIAAEMYALQEVSGMHPKGSLSKVVSCSTGLWPGGNSAPMVLDRGGREIHGTCCAPGMPGMSGLSGLFWTQPGRQPAATAGSHDSHLRGKVRKELEAEFHTKKVGAAFPSSAGPPASMRPKCTADGRRNP
mmetsp:Transcript_101312/g.285691  ORF Transcript_101312/g.285691 Transcript_101312/m.285691 type:complete len:608 (-) Transcript_101312:126-1949(-)